MIYPNNFEEKIGFDKIRKLLQKKCLSTLGQEKVENCNFQTDFEIINSMMKQTHELMNIISNENDFPVSYLIDTRKALKDIRIIGRWIDEQSLFDLKRSLQTICDLTRFFCKDALENTLYPNLYLLANDVPIFPDLVKNIDKILDTFGQVKDNASVELSKIRKEKAHVAGSISKTLHAILRNAQSEGIVDKDTTPSIRDGRLVIPVAPMHKRRIKGIVHDESATGKTVFIEPVQIVEANNKIRELENDERREIIKILTLISDEIRPNIEDIILSYDFLGEIDFLRAKATFAEGINAITPLVEDTQQIDWIAAKHPLLYLSLQKQGKSIVPLDIKLDSENRILIISGPNAGGKSVCLKTVGLLQYMVQCGIPIPLAENSKVGIFEYLFIDIGDEQSIEDDLSTYSSHLTNMKFFDKNSNNKTLILIDEFGGGTEPEIGGAIAESLLQRFNQKHLYGVITTHYQNLKHFANENQGVVNGAMLYDRHLMQPLYTLSIGNPGSSFAIEIARKIGLPEGVIEYATQIVGADYVNMDKYLQDIVRDKRYWETKRQQIRKNEKQLEELVENYEQDLAEVKKERKKILTEAKAEAERLLNETNAKIENTIRGIRESQAEKEKTKLLRRELSDFKAELQQFENVKNSEQDIKQNVSEKAVKLQKQKQVEKLKEQEDIKVGSTVRMKGQYALGEVIEMQKNNAVVVFGSLRSTVKLSLLEFVSKNQVKKENKATYSTSLVSDEMREKKLNFKQDLDIRGFRGEEALQAVMYFVDDAILVGMPRVRILHGTGTGILRNLIREYLRTNPTVKAFADEHIDFGGVGITVIDLE